MEEKRYVKIFGHKIEYFTEKEIIKPLKNEDYQYIHWGFRLDDHEYNKKILYEHKRALYLANPDNHDYILSLNMAISWLENYYFEFKIEKINIDCNMLVSI